MSRQPKRILIKKRGAVSFQLQNLKKHKTKPQKPQTMTKNTLLENLKNNHSCFFSLEQVIGLIESIEEQPKSSTTTVGENQLNQFSRKLICAIQDEIDNINTKDMWNDSDVEISVDYDRQIQIDDVQIDMEIVKEAIDDALKQFLSDCDGEYFLSKVEVVEEEVEEEEDNSTN